jgi:hypothetical protein
MTLAFCDNVGEVDIIKYGGLFAHLEGGIDVYKSFSQTGERKAYRFWQVILLRMK